MHGSQVLMVSENADCINVFERPGSCPVQAGGIVPPGSIGDNRQAAVEIVLLGTVEVFPMVRGGDSPLDGKKRFGQIRVRISGQKSEGDSGETDGRINGQDSEKSSGQVLGKIPRNTDGRLSAEDVSEVRQKLAGVRGFIQTHYAEKITMEKLADVAGLEQAELVRIFRKKEGISLPAFLENTRLERAAALLRGTKRTLSVIAEGVGFSNVSYFSQRFRKAYGITPGHYRRKCVRDEHT